MTNLLKKSVLIVTTLGYITSNVVATDNQKSTASSGSVALASLGMIAGAGCAALAGTGSIAQVLNCVPGPSILPPSMSAQLSSTARYDILILPGAMLMLGGVLYCLKSAKGVLPKFRSTLGSLITIGGGFVLAFGCFMYVAADGQRTRTLVTTGKDSLWYFAHGATPLPSNATTALSMGAIATTLTGAVTSAIGYTIQPVDKNEKQT